MNARIKHEKYNASYKDDLRVLYGNRYYPDLGGADGTVKDFSMQDLCKLVEEVGWVIIIDYNETEIFLDIYDDYIE